MDDLDSAPQPSREQTTQFIEEAFWGDWAASIDVKQSNQGKMILGLGGVVLIGLALTGLQGKVVVKLVKGYGEIVEIINHSGIIPSATVDSEQPAGRYGKPSGSVTTPPAPVDEEELAKLHETIRATSDTPRPEDIV